MSVFHPYKLAFLALLLLLVAVASVGSLLSGDISISWDQLLVAFQHPDSIEYSVLVNLRIPRLLLAFAVGASLSLSGAILQGIYKNPLVEPFTLGISGGASLGVAIVIVMGFSSLVSGMMLPLAGFSGAFATILLVYFIGSKRGGGSINRMLLIGVMISFICSSLLMFLLSISTAQDMHSIIFWTMGSLEEPNGTLIAVVLIGSLTVFLASHLFAHALNALRLGEEEASHLGINVPRAIKTLFIMASLLTGICVSVAGIIGFVGLVIPHLMKRAVGSDYRILLSACFLGGGLFLIVCDLLARTLIAPNELPVGVLTGIIGGTLFIFLLTQKGSGWKS